MCQLAEQHSNQLRPAVKPPSVAFRLVFFGQRRKFAPRDLFKQLTKQARSLYHGGTLLLSLFEQILIAPALSALREGVVKTAFLTS